MTKRLWYNDLAYRGVLMRKVYLDNTAAAPIAQEVREAMLPFLGYHMGDYFAHWLSFGQKSHVKLPGIFYVNWFREDEKGNYLWPGYGENIHVLKWIFERTSGEENKVKTPIGYLPKNEALPSIAPDTLKKLLEVNTEEWKKEVEGLKNYFKIFGERVPKEMLEELQNLESRLQA